MYVYIHTINLYIVYCLITSLNKINIELASRWQTTVKWEHRYRHAFCFRDLDVSFHQWPFIYPFSHRLVVFYNLIIIKARYSSIYTKANNVHIAPVYIYSNTYIDAIVILCQHPPTKWFPLPLLLTPCQQTCYMYGKWTQANIAPLMSRHVFAYQYSVILGWLTATNCPLLQNDIYLIRSKDHWQAIVEVTIIYGNSI